MFRKMVVLLVVVALMLLAVGLVSADRVGRPNKADPPTQYWFLLEHGDGYLICPTAIEPEFLAANALHVNCSGMVPAGVQTVIYATVTDLTNEEIAVGWDGFLEYVESLGGEVTGGPQYP